MKANGHVSLFSARQKWSVLTRFVNCFLRIAKNQFETMLRIEVGTMPATVYLEHSPYESGTEIRIQFWDDYRSSGSNSLDKPDLPDVSNDQIIRANDIIAENEWNTGTWAAYLYRNSETLNLVPVGEPVNDEMFMKIGMSAPKARVHRTSLCA